ncbi:PASTA domain-containing protein [Actinoplanes sp. NPDC048796]|uniref:PASTA domain-containing protein n=1 Tax=Actinoplanes sp. NPDC048796 TaxID=3155640 RepID=UPI0033C15F37
MSDEKRPGEPAAEDSTGPDKPAAGPGKPDAAGPDKAGDATRLDLPAVADETKAVPAADETKAVPAADDETDDETKVEPAKAPPPSDEDTLSGGARTDDTLDDVRTVPAYKDTPVKDAPTAVMPVDDWAPSRANPAWSGRAEVRAPQPGRGYPEVDWAAADAEPPGRDRWWMPIVVGVIALVLLGVLGWAIYLIVQDDDSDDTPTPAVTMSSAAAPTRTATTATSATTETTAPSTAPPTTTTAPTPTTTDPTDTEVTVPALRGLALAAAESALNETGLNYRIKYRAVNAPAGTVVDSDPAEGQEVPPDTVVTLVVAADAATTVPTTATTGATPGADTDGQ